MSRDTTGTRHWANIGEAGFTGGMRCLLWLHRIGGHHLFRLALYPVIFWYVLVRRSARHASRDYLAHLHAHSGGASPAPRFANVFRHFMAFGQTLLDKLRAWSGEQDWAVHFSGEESLLSLAREGRGAVVVMAHMGNLEVSRVIGALHGLRINALVHTRHAERFNNLLKSLNPDSGLSLLQVGALDPATAMQLSAKVAAGETIMIAGDRVPLDDSRATLRLPFLGAEADFPIGPYVLAGLLRCPLLGMLTSEQADGHHFRIFKLADEVRLDRRDRLGSVRPLAQAFVQQLETECHTAPLQWFNFFPFWAART
ncbi:LpxL/LpxP family acyltransferase [Uliginosibacterium sp. H1]|uniref:LpxL/LpxP family acyltransferase n=1 Tax=Uliginosibacterium sp. H1 TaxID=3114757 RepID=UPI002E16FA33|nr:hypothetical protein [Uliginosibacterium sp. H1]